MQTSFFVWHTSIAASLCLMDICLSNTINDVKTKILIICLC